MADSEEFEVVEAESQEEITDPMTVCREECEEYAAKFKEILDECNERVRSRKKTDETCHEEMVNYIQALDDCAAPKAFAKLK